LVSRVLYYYLRRRQPSVSTRYRTIAAISYMNLSHSMLGLRATLVAGLAIHIWLAGAAPTAPHTVTLRREQVRPVAENSRDLAAASAGKVFYVGRILVGRPIPQQLSVAFDIGSGMVVLPSTRCSAPACTEHRRYDAAASDSSFDINGDGTLVQAAHRLARDGTERDALTVGLSNTDLGDGEVTGELVYDRVCFSSDGRSRMCTDVGLVSATNVTDVPFRAMPQDGTIGLGLGGLSVSPLFCFLDRLFQVDGGAAPRRQFGLFLGTRSGELTFGGFDDGRLASPLAWAPVVEAETGYWQLSIRSIRVGDLTLSACDAGACRGIVDNGASHVGVPRAIAAELLEALGGAECPDVHIDLGGSGPTLTLRAEDYGGRKGCSDGAPGFSELDLPGELANTFLLGEPILRRYYSVFDWEARTVGFGLARAETAAEAEAGEAAAEQEAAAIPVPEDVVARAEGMMFVLVRALGMQLCMVCAFALVGRRASALSLKQVMVFILDCLQLGGKGLDVLSGLSRVPPAEAPQADDCAICLGSCEDDCDGARRPAWRRLQCGHAFHEQCVHQWLRKAQQCPVCRSPTTPAWAGSGPRRPSQLEAALGAA